MSDTKDTYQETMDMLFGRSSTAAIRDERVRELLKAERELAAAEREAERLALRVEHLEEKVPQVVELEVFQAMTRAREELSAAEHPSAWRRPAAMIADLVREAITNIREPVAEPKIETPPTPLGVAGELADAAASLNVGSEIILAGKLLAAESSMWEPKMAPAERRLEELLAVAKSAAKANLWLESLGAIALAASVRPSIAGRAHVTIGSLFESVITERAAAWTSASFGATAYGGSTRVQLCEHESLLAAYEDDDDSF